MGTGADYELGDEPWRQWLRRVVGDHGGPVAVAKLSRISKQSLDNHLHNRVKNPNVELLQRVADACAVVLDWAVFGTGAQSESGSGEFQDEAVPFKGAVPDLPPKPEHGRGYWRVEQRSLDLRGWLPGDIGVFDFTDLSPRADDIVVAQHYAPDGLSARTVLRVFQPPYLMVETTDRSIDRRPLLIEPGKVVVMGTWRRLVRTRQT